MSGETDQQRAARIQSEVESLLGHTNRLNYMASETTGTLIVEVDRYLKRAQLAEKELAGLKIENSGLVSAVESIAADRRVWEGRFNDAFTDYCEADEQLRVAKRVAWACVALTTILFLAMIYGEYN